MPACPASGWRLATEEREKDDRNRKKEREEEHRRSRGYLAKYDGLMRNTPNKESTEEVVKDVNKPAETMNPAVSSKTKPVAP